MQYKLNFIILSFARDYTFPTHYCLQKICNIVLYNYFYTQIVPLFKYFYVILSTSVFLN